MSTSEIKRYHYRTPEEPRCCFIHPMFAARTHTDESQCPLVAEFSIHDSRDHTPDQSSSTHACEEHVGALLGTSMALPKESQGSPGHWLVYELTATPEPLGGTHA